MSSTPTDTAVRVLHVDDEPDFAELAAEFMRREDDGLAIETETDPEAALERLEGEAFDCVVSDYDMPTLTGLDLLREVRVERPDLPFILFTGKGSEEVASDAISAGVTDYLQKEGGTDQYALLVNRLRNAVERHRAKEAAEATERWAQTLLAHSSDFLFVVDGGGEIAYASPSIERTLGYRPAEIVGLSAFEFVHPDDLESARAAFGEVLADGEAEPTVEFRAIDADGGTRWLEVRGRNLLDDPAVEGVLVNARDVTQRQALEAELEDTLGRYETIVEQNVAGIYILQDGEWVYANPRACEIVGYDESALLEMDDATSIVAEGSREKVRERIRERLAGEVDEVEYTLTIVRGEDGERRTVRVHGRRIEHEGAPAIMGTVVDVTETERAKERYQALLRNSHEAIARVEFDGGTPIIREHNDTFAALFVPGDGSAVGEDIDEVVAGETRREDARDISRRVRDGEAMRGRLTRDTIDGPREFNWQAIPIGDPSDGPIESGFAIYTQIAREHPVEGDPYP